MFSQAFACQRGKNKPRLKQRKPQDSLIQL
jgi:hypothetical protein